MQTEDMEEIAQDSLRGRQKEERKDKKSIFSSYYYLSKRGERISASPFLFE
jgi:hypothetical protein